MNSQNLEKQELSELEALKNDLEFTELEDRLEMVQAAAAAADRCNNKGCEVNGTC